MKIMGGVQQIKYLRSTQLSRLNNVWMRANKNKISKYI